SGPAEIPVTEAKRDKKGEDRLPASCSRIRTGHGRNRLGRRKCQLPCSRRTPTHEAHEVDGKDQRTMTWNRRTLLKGAGAAVAPPLLDSLLPRRANGAPAAVPARVLTVFFPDGRGPFRLPEGTGSGDDWQLSALLEQFASLKQKMTVITNLE